MINALLVRWNGGWSEVTRGGSIGTFGRTEAVLGLGAISSYTEMARVAAGQLDVYANPREEINTAVLPVGPTDDAYLSFGVADTVTVPARLGGSTVEKCIEISISEDNDTGRAQVSPTFHDVILAREEAFGQALKKMTNGTVAGTSKVATPVSQVSSSVGTNNPTPQSSDVWNTAGGDLIPTTQPTRDFDLVVGQDVNISPTRDLNLGDSGSRDTNIVGGHLVNLGGGGGGPVTITKMAPEFAGPVSTLGAVVGRVPIFDTAGALLGYLPVYDSIT